MSYYTIVYTNLIEGHMEKIDEIINEIKDTYKFNNKKDIDKLITKLTNQYDKYIEIKKKYNNEIISTFQ